jgi:hypothetical protein
MQSNRNQHLVSTSVFFMAASLVACGISSCGLNKKEHYPGKTFGKTTEDQTPEAADPQPDLPPPDSEPTVPQDPEDPVIPTDQVLSHYGFGGSFNLATTRRIFRGADSDRNGSISTGGALDTLAAKALKYVIGDQTANVESLSMLIQQNGVGHNTVTQKVITAGGDNISQFKHEDTQSGTQIIDWALTGTAVSASCPRQFVCIERMAWVPKSGTSKTYCYVDRETQTPVSIPYSPNSNYSKEAFAIALGAGLTSRPIDVIAHPGNVKCDAPDLEIRDRKPVQYKLTMGTRSISGMIRATHRPLPSDAEIVIEYSLLGGESLTPYLPKTGPYIDQLTRLNSKVSYFINSEKHVMVKIERTVLSPLKLEGSAIADYMRENYGQWAAWAFEWAFPAHNDTEGVQLLYSFEFCTHLSVVPNYYNHCTGLITP